MYGWMVPASLLLRWFSSSLDVSLPPLSHIFQCKRWLRKTYIFPGLNFTTRRTHPVSNTGGLSKIWRVQRTRKSLGETHNRRMWTLACQDLIALQNNHLFCSHHRFHSTCFLRRENFHTIKQRSLGKRPGIIRSLKWSLGGIILFQLKLGNSKASMGSWSVILVKGTCCRISASFSVDHYWLQDQTIPLNLICCSFFWLAFMGCSQWGQFEEFTRFYIFSNYKGKA